MNSDGIRNMALSAIAGTLVGALFSMNMILNRIATALEQLVKLYVK